MKSESQIQTVESETQPGEQEGNELRELTLEEMGEVGGGIIKHAPVADGGGRF